MKKPYSPERKLLYSVRVSVPMTLENELRRQAIAKNTTLSEITREVLTRGLKTS